VLVGDSKNQSETTPEASNKGFKRIEIEEDSDEEDSGEDDGEDKN